MKASPESYMLLRWPCAVLQLRYATQSIEKVVGERQGNNDEQEIFIGRSSAQMEDLFPSNWSLRGGVPVYETRYPSD